ncbi:MAG: hypothetical protein V8S72_08750 [Oscillospiraceae bacterium]
MSLRSTTTLKLAADVLGTKIARAEADASPDDAICNAGLDARGARGRACRKCQKYDCAWGTENPSEDEYPTVPVQLKNNKFTNALNMVTNMYSLPAYGSVLTPNPLWRRSSSCSLA